MSTPRVIKKPAFFNAQFGEAGPARNLVELEAVVHAVADSLVAEAVELRAHLADFGDHQLFIAAALIGFRKPVGALGAHQARGAQHGFRFIRLAEPR